MSAAEQEILDGIARLLRDNKAETAQLREQLANLTAQNQALQERVRVLQGERARYLHALLATLPPCETPFTDEELADLECNGLDLAETMRELAAIKKEMSANPRRRRTIPHTELPTESLSGSGLNEEWNTYRREVGRLLSEGNEGRFVLIKGHHIIGLFDTWEEARTQALKRYLREHSLTKQILANEPVYYVKR